MQYKWFSSEILLTTLSLHSYLDQTHKKWAKRTQLWHRFSAAKHALLIISSESTDRIREVASSESFCAECSGKTICWKLKNNLSSETERIRNACIHFEYAFYPSFPSTNHFSEHIIADVNAEKAGKIKIYHFFLVPSITELGSSMFRLCCLFPFRALNKSCAMKAWINGM